MREKDIFDKIMEIKLFKPIYPFYKKYKEGLLYLFFGGLTVIVVIGIYIVLNIVISVDPLIANAISWLCGVLFSFFTTRKWVFNSTTSRLRELISQVIRFGVARLATLLLQELLIYIFVSCMELPSVFIKICTEIINIIINYLVSKRFIFSKRK